MTPTARPAAGSPQAEKSASSTAAILDATIELVLEHGAKVSVVAIGKRSGYSPSLVLARFGSKGGLIDAVAHEARRRYVSSVDEITAGAEGVAKLHRLIDAFFQPPTTVGKAFFVLLGESMGPDLQLREVFSRADHAFRRWVEVTLDDARRLGELDDRLDTQATAVLVVGMLRGVAVQYCVNDSAFDMEAMRPHAHELITRLCSPRADASSSAKDA